jgi:hypothetical protein
MICKSCEEFFKWLQGPRRPVKGEKLREKFYHHRTWKAWQKAIAQGCIFCTFTQKQFETLIEDFLSGKNDEDQVLQPTLFWERYGDKFPSLVLSEELEEADGHLLDFQFVPVEPGQGEISYRHQYIDPSESQDTDGKWNTRSTWNSRLQAHN